ncbi:putative PWWP domain containing protein PWWP2 [Dioscorea sansibarensis]
MAGIDAVAGALVWIRRRNGSWWPGRILGVDELPEECLVLPMSGTPIKLLGRDDASIDWYNLEKSTRVKTFRCGDYDKDIEKAKASVGRANKKAPNAGKYVRREDAILHALELEGNQSSIGSEKKCLELNNMINKIDFSLATKPKSTSVHSKRPGCISGKYFMIDDISTQDLSQSVVSFEEPNNPSTADMRIMQKRRWRTPYDTEDDDTGETRRTKGLQDLGLGILTGRRPASRVHKKSSHAIYPVSTGLSKSNSGNAFSNDSPISNARNSFLPLKRKKSPVTHTYENSKRKIRPLVKVLASTTRMLVPSFHNDLLAEQSFAPKRRKALKSTEVRMTHFSVGTGSDHSGTSCGGVASDASENTCSDAPDGNGSCSEMEDNDLSSLLEFSGSKCSDSHLGASPAVGERETRDYACMSDSYESRMFHPAAVKQSSQCSQVGILTCLQEELGETGSTGSAVHPVCVGHKIDKGRSRLNAKGRKKPKYVTLSKTAYSEGFLESADQSGTNMTGRAANNKIKRKALDECLASGNGSQMVKKVSLSENPSDVPQFWTSKTSVVERYLASEVHVQSAEDVNNAFYNLPFTRCSEMLFTGDVAVSTMSLGKSPAHHPMASKHQVTELSRSVLVVSQLYDVKLDVQRNHRGPHVPLVSLQSKSDDISVVGHPLTIEVLLDGYCDYLLEKNACHQDAPGIEKSTKNIIGIIAKSRRTTRVASQTRTVMQQKISGDLMHQSSYGKGKSSKSKKPGFSPRKIRRLSSITVDHIDNEEDRKPVVDRIRGPAVACIPLRIVFSRINEALSNSVRPATCI